MQTVNIEATLPSGNTYGIDTPVEYLTHALPFDFIRPLTPVPEMVPPDDVPSYRAAMAAGVYVAQQELLSQMIRAGWQPKRASAADEKRILDALDIAAPPVDLTEFAENLVAHWKQLRILVDTAEEERGNGGLWFSALYQAAAEGGGDSAAVYGVQYLKLRRQGRSAESIATAIAEAIVA